MKNFHYRWGRSHIKLCVIYKMFCSTHRINSDGVIKVADFGLAEELYSKDYFRQDKSDTVRLPFKWMAPESLKDGVFSEKTDVVCVSEDLSHEVKSGHLHFIQSCTHFPLLSSPPPLPPPSLLLLLCHSGHLV